MLKLNAMLTPLIDPFNRFKEKIIVKLTPLVVVKLTPLVVDLSRNLKAIVETQ